MKANKVLVPSLPSERARRAHSAPRAQRPLSGRARLRSEAKLWIAAALLLLAGGIACSNNDGPVFLDARDASDTDSTADDGRRPPPDGEDDDQTDPQDTQADTQTDVEDDLPPPPTPCEEDTDCDDGRFCNGTESCSEAGQCLAGVAVVCEDEVGCTRDLCDEDTQRCLNIADATQCENNEYCHPTADCTRSPRCFDSADCDDGVACSVEFCINGECKYQADDAACDQGDFCTGAERCAPFVGCIEGVERTCDDSDTCTLNTCDADALACVFLPRDDDRDGDQGAACGGLDCDDLDPEAHPSLPETCDGKDNNCDGYADEIAPFSEPNTTTIAAAAGSQPRFVTLSDGQSAALWLTPDRTLHVQFFAADDTPGQVVALTNTASDRPGAFAAAPTADGRLLVVRSTGSVNGPFDITATRIHPDATQTPLQNLTDDRPDIAFVNVLTTATHTDILWQDSRSGVARVYMTRLSTADAIDPGFNQKEFGTAAYASQPAAVVSGNGQTVITWIEPRAGDGLPILALSEADSAAAQLLDASAGVIDFSAHPQGDDLLLTWTEAPSSTRTNLRITRLSLPLDTSSAAEIPLADPPGNATQPTLIGTGPFASVTYLLSNAAGQRAQWVAIDPVTLTAAAPRTLISQPTEHVTQHFNGSFLRALAVTSTGTQRIDSTCPSSN